MAWETQGAVTDRARENLGVSDTGIVLYRKLFQEQLDLVASGKDPHGVIRDSALNNRIKIEVSTGQARMAKMKQAAN
jgi:5,5'-dehydrodivanillate O-demethylase